MSPAQEVCVDASVAVKVVVTEPDSDKADALFDAWAHEGKQLRCEFWTTEERLYNRVKDTLTFVKWLRNYIPKTAGPS
jgi:predicted nucleic acid-binding protein